ncbi:MULTISPECIES: hypothetical protein [Pseudomonas]|uniref:Uncharacterized protein n=1 Tax=Pseudomonas chlororaphis TaxID=587753 RepID=A0AAP9VS17_9PSED|nr:MULTISPECIES: hypothetical protein [Pseudomonas]AUG42038.1 hypothetical protein CXP47_19870 [Pseudomonas chlororaphis]AZE12380.1 hypothetical protein C4K10_4108 [Pseudomonas chlororaphis subsp. aureofaciens]AZE18365.1 hypothetical protein C4K09_3912 [Pseudomonas chlororaphis subsp. aureofaciens]POA67313.1 hypothetical protein C1888_20265 [Pseudomonas sp. GW531-T4]PWY40491.1 hypothetical protein DK261_13090 [Pseudomonas sp. RW409]
MIGKDELNELLIGHNCVESMCIESEDGIVKYNLLLTLAESESYDSKKIKVCFYDVSSLSVKEFGGGLTQFMHLKISKTNSGFDRARYELSEMEDEKIYCLFFGFALIDE